MVEFDTEEGATYNYCIEKEVKAGKVRLARSTERKLGTYQQICQIGAVVEVKWAKDYLVGTDWQPGMCGNFSLAGICI